MSKGYGKGLTSFDGDGGGEIMETTLLLKQEALVYKLPPSSGSVSSGWKANGWNLDHPDWLGKLRLVSKGTDCFIRLEKKETGEVYAVCPVDCYPGPAVQTVTDSSRYFVIKIVNPQDQKIAHLGLGFADRSDSFDLNVALQDHFKGIRNEERFKIEAEAPQEKLDLALKEGQTIKVSINIPRAKKKGASGSSGYAKNDDGGIAPPPRVNMAEAVAAAGIKVEKDVRIQAPPTKSVNPNWIQF